MDQATRVNHAHCRACFTLQDILDSAEIVHRAFEPWAWDIMYDELHAELADRNWEKPDR